MARIDRRADALAAILDDGVSAAVEALIAVARDPTAQPAARASAAAHLLRAAGILSAAEGSAAARADGVGDAATVEDLRQALARLRAERDALTGPASAPAPARKRRGRPPKGQ